MYLSCVVTAPNGVGFVGFLRRKNDNARLYKDKKEQWEKIANVKMDRHRSDRGTEYTSGVMTQLCADRGIVQTFTAPDSSAGPAESRIGTLQRMARAMMNKAGQGDWLWDEATAYGNDILNCLPTTAGGLDGKQNAW